MNDRLEKLENRIEIAKAKKEVTSPGKNEKGAFIIATELVSGAIVGVIIGLLVDKMFNSKPLFLILCIVFGVIASFKNIWQNTR